MAAVTLTTLRARARELSDLVGSTFVSDGADSLDAWLNAGLDALYDLLVQTYGEDYFLTSSSFTTVAGTATYALPATFGKLRGVDLTLNGVQIPLQKFNFAERNRLRDPVIAGDVPEYRLQGSLLWLAPTPTAARSGTIWFVPSRPLLVNAGDTVDVPNGWEDYAVLEAAIRAGLKEESDISGWLALQERLKVRLEAAAENRDAGAPEQVVDTDNLGPSTLWRTY
jgi:hypothetical protein